MSCRNMFHNSVGRMGPSVAVVAGIVWVLCVPYQAAAQGGFSGPGRYEITNLESGKVIELDRNNQTSVIQFSSRGTDNQAWEIQAAGWRLLFPAKRDDRSRARSRGHQQQHARAGRALQRRFQPAVAL